MPASEKAVFTLVAIKPTHYDDDGYPIQWLRSDSPIENPLVFYPKYGLEISRKAAEYGWMIFNAYRAYRAVMREPDKEAYTDVAITPASETEHDALHLFTDTHGGENAVKRSRADKRIR